MTGRHRRFSHPGMWISIIVVLLFFIALQGSSAAVRYRGSVYRGLAEETLRAGGSTLEAQAQSPIFEGYDEAHLKNLMVEMLSMSHVMSEEGTKRETQGPSNWWLRQLPRLMDQSRIEVKDKGRTVRLTFHTLPDCVVEEPLLVIPCLPPSIVQKSQSRGLSEKDMDCNPGNAFVITRKTSIHVDKDRIARMAPAQYITGNIIEIPLLKETSVEVGSRIKVMDGTGCANTVGAMISGSGWDEENEVYRFVASRGGLVTLCYMPFPGTLPHVMLKLGDSLTIAGPEGASTEPLRLISSAEFTGYVFGTNLSENDELIITERSCNKFNINNSIVPELSLFSTSRAVFVGTINKEGTYNVCYCREGSTRHVRVTTLLVEKGLDNAEKAKLEHFHLDRKMDPHSASIPSVLHVNQTESLSLKQESLNVSSLVWSGGSIMGEGEINCLGSSSITSHSEEPLNLTFILRNYGDMVIDVPQLILEGTGVLYNYGNLTITVAHMGNEKVATILSRNRNNAIINLGGTINITAMEHGFSTLCQTYIMNREGTLTLSGKVKFADMVTEEKSALVLKQGSKVSAAEARLSGVIELFENSLLKLTGDASLASANVKGKQGRILITGKSLTLDSLTVTGEVAVDITGRLEDSSRILVVLYGMITFAERSHLNLYSGRFMASTGLVQLVIAGVLTAQIDAVVFSGNLWIQNNHMAFIYGSGTKYRLLEREESSLVSFVVREDATLVALDVDLPLNSLRTCDSLLSFSDYLRVDGRFLLRGCVTVPLGGAIGGSVEQLKFPDDAAMLRALVVAANTHAPVNPFSVPRASLILGGEILLRNGAKLDLSEIIMKNAVLTGEGAIYLGAKDTLSVDYGSRLALQRSCVINASVMLVEGLLEADVSPGPLIRGSVDIASGGRVKLYSVRKPLCKDELRAVGGVRWAEDSIVECYSYSLLSVPDYSTPTIERKKSEDFRRKWFALPPSVECSDEDMQEEANRLFTSFYHFYMVPYDPPLDVPSMRDIIIWGMAISLLSLAVMHVFLSYRGMTWRQLFIDCKTEPPLRLTLSRSEFTQQTMNYVVLAMLIFSALQTSIVAILPQTPLPLGFMSTLRVRTMVLLIPHRLVNAHLTMRRVMIATLVWGFIAVVLMIMSKKRFSRRLHKRWVQIIIQIISAMDQVLQLFFVVFSFPVRSLILDSFACNTFLSDLPTCSGVEDYLFMPIISILLLHFIMPLGRFSAMRLVKCDLQCKRSVLLCLHILSLMEVSMWKLFSNRPLLFGANNFAFRCFRLLLLSKATPTAYTNVNRFLVRISATTLAAHVYVIFHVIRVYLGFAKTCHDGNIYFIVGIILWLSLLGWNLWTNIIAPQDEYITSNNAAIDAIQRSIQQIYSRIQELQYEFLACASVEERENVLNATARLNMELVEKQKRYRYEKYCLLSNFYFDGSAHDSIPLGGINLTRKLSNHSGDLDASAILSSPLSSSTSNMMNSYSDSDDSLQGPLTQEEMMSFRCGPALGSGSYGTVHLGILPSGKLVAVKYVSTQNTTKESLVQVKTEINTLNELSHPNIIRYYGCCTDHDHILVFMEFAVAGSLTSIVRNFAGLNESVIRYYTHQMLLGLRYLHEKGVVHRDIKGENILVDGLGVVKLADFGSSKILPSIHGHSRAGCETLTGSPYWMAPEVIRNDPYGTKADIWSVGCTVVELLNGGVPPWRDDFENVFSMMYYVGTTDILPTIPQDCSELCRDFLKKCLERDTAKRPSADELLLHPWVRDAEKNSVMPVKGTSSL